MNTLIAYPEAFTIFPNPDNPLEIKLPTFEGPLDLLLHLIRKNELNIYEVKLSTLTASYLSYLEFMQAVNLDIAGEFLEIAATLILLKSRQLLPRPEVIDDEDEELDPEEQLRQRLIEYQRYKNAAFDLSSRDVLGRDVFIRPPQEELLADKTEQEPVFEEVSLYALMEAFRNVMERRPKITSHVVESEQYRIEDCIEELIQKFDQNPRYLFEELFEPEQPRMIIILKFMAILEMVKQRLITIVQLKLCGPIHCMIHEDFKLNLADWYLQTDKAPLEKTA